MEKRKIVSLSRRISAAYPLIKGVFSKATGKSSETRLSAAGLFLPKEFTSA